MLITKPVIVDISPLNGSFGQLMSATCVHLVLSRLKLKHSCFASKSLDMPPQIRIWLRSTSTAPSLASGMGSVKNKVAQLSPIVSYFSIV